MRRRLAASLALAVLLLPSLGHDDARAAEYSMATVARYVVDGATRQIEVSVEVVFTNTTPNPPGQVSGFDRVDLGIHAGASDVLAEDATGSLGVSVGDQDGGLVASVKTRSRVLHNGSVSFTLSYTLRDGAAPGVHARPQVVEFAAWGFGTTSDVTIDLLGIYALDIAGDPLDAVTKGDTMQLASGPIADPASWLALVTASAPADYSTISQSVALASGTADLQVRAWSDDPDWGRRILALMARALPLLEEEIGLPYARVGPLVVTEVAGSGDSGEPASSTAEIGVDFDEPDFTVLHQAAHVWIGEELAADRWIREGLASHFVARAAGMLGVELPYAPAERAIELEADAIPLAAWGTEATSGAEDAYAYAASWAFINRVATAVGEAHLVEAIGRVAAGVSAYDNVDAALPSAPGGPPVRPLDTRRLLDQLAAVSGVDLSALFLDVVLGEDAALELAHRAQARSAYDDLLAAAGDWGAPDPSRLEMADWRFDDARGGIDEALAWLARRDGLLERAAAAGLITPDRLRARYMADGGGTEAVAELEAEGAVVDAFLAVRAHVDAPRGPLDAIGLLGAEDPGTLLGDASRSFTAGDLQAAADTLQEATLQLNRATADGLVRVVLLVVLVAVLAAALGRSRWRRRGSHYTAAG